MYSVGNTGICNKGDGQKTSTQNKNVKGIHHQKQGWWGSAEADHSLPSTAKVITSTGMHMDSFTLRLYMSHFVHMYHFPHTLYSYIIFYEK
jgi:hypothetical protein